MERCPRCGHPPQGPTWEVRTPDGIGEVCSACAHLFEAKRQMPPAVVVKAAPVTAQMDLFG